MGRCSEAGWTLACKKRCLIFADAGHGEVMSEATTRVECGSRTRCVCMHAASTMYSVCTACCVLHASTREGRRPQERVCEPTLVWKEKGIPCPLARYPRTTNDGRDTCMPDGTSVRARRDRFESQKEEGRGCQHRQFADGGSCGGHMGFAAAVLPCLASSIRRGIWEPRPKTQAQEGTRPSRVPQPE